LTSRYVAGKFASEKSPYGSSPWLRYSFSAMKYGMKCAHVASELMRRAGMFTVLSIQMRKSVVP
jgi:hypothetical protein